MAKYGKNLGILFHFALTQSGAKVEKKRTLTRYAAPAPTRFFWAFRPKPQAEAPWLLFCDKRIRNNSLNYLTVSVRLFVYL